MTTKTGAQRFKEHVKRKKEQGLVRRTFWVPADKTAEIKTYIEQQTNDRASK